VELPSDRDVFARLVGWAETKPEVRALILTSTRARGDGDLLSDYDVVVAARPGFVLDVTEYGEPMAGWRDTGFHGVVYRDGVRIDYTIRPEEWLAGVSSELPADLDVGYRVLLDKDGATAGWPEATFRAHVPHPPTQDELDALVHEFWWDTTYVAKALHRGELFFAKYVFEYDVKGVALRRLLEWRVELDHDWALRPGAYGRGLERLVPPDVWAELAQTYVGVDPEESWTALFRTAALFRRVAKDVAGALGLEYPQASDDGVTAYLEAIRNL
jgi:aminoglycoside 6-adenylyltransferase